jgi:hypothetical protein
MTTLTPTEYERGDINTHPCGVARIDVPPAHQVHAGSSRPNGAFTPTAAQLCLWPLLGAPPSSFPLFFTSETGAGSAGQLAGTTPAQTFCRGPQLRARTDPAMEATTASTHTDRPGHKGHDCKHAHGQTCHEGDDYEHVDVEPEDEQQHVDEAADHEADRQAQPPLHDERLVAPLPQLHVHDLPREAAHHRRRK